MNHGFDALAIRSQHDAAGDGDHLNPWFDFLVIDLEHRPLF
jgi:hypothetical protein